MWSIVETGWNKYGTGYPSIDSDLILGNTSQIVEETFVHTS